MNDGQKSKIKVSAKGTPSFSIEQEPYLIQGGAVG